MHVAHGQFPGLAVVALPPESLAQHSSPEFSQHFNWKIKKETYQYTVHVHLLILSENCIHTHILE